jgi:hypothetical protein
MPKEFEIWDAGDNGHSLLPASHRIRPPTPDQHVRQQGWPREVEDVLVSHPAVCEAAVIGIPDAYRIECVCAAITLHPAVPFDLEDLKQW